MDLGPQPLDRLLTARDLSNHQLVEAGRADQLTHKQVQKARKGRRLTPNLKRKIVRAMTTATGERFELDQLFDY